MFGLLLWERLASKCACNVVKEKASDFLSPFQFGVASPSRSEKIIHNLREVLEQHWSDPDFAVIKIDMQNASILYLVMSYFSSVSCTSQRFTHGPAGATHNTQNFGILLA